MPTPDETAFPPSPPIDIPARSAFPSCPPEEEREPHSESDDDQGEEAAAPAETSDHAIAQEPTPEPDALEGASSENAQAQSKDRIVEDATAAIAPHTPSPTASTDAIVAPDGEMQAQASSNPHASVSLPPQYLDVTPDKDRVSASHLLSYTGCLLTVLSALDITQFLILFPATRQQIQGNAAVRPPSIRCSGGDQRRRHGRVVALWIFAHSRSVKNEATRTSLARPSHRTKSTNTQPFPGLTDDHPTLTTFFEGEIIGPKHLFKTTHPSWGSSEKVDLQHWARFPAWRPLAKSAAKSPSFTLKNYQQREHIFMRWKEYFLVPDHRVKTITGASFEGFYYICFNQCDGSVSGIYFHAKSEKYQQLDLKHVEDGGCVGAMEFR